MESPHKYSVADLRQVGALTYFFTVSLVKMYWFLCMERKLKLTVFATYKGSNNSHCTCISFAQRLSLSLCDSVPVDRDRRMVVSSVYNM